MPAAPYDPYAQQQRDPVQQDPNMLALTNQLGGGAQAPMTASALPSSPQTTAPASPYSTQTSQTPQTGYTPNQFQDWVTSQYGSQYTYPNYTPQYQQIAQQVGYGGSGNLTPEQYQQGQSLVQQWAQQAGIQPVGTPTPTPGSTPANPFPTLPPAPAQPTLTQAQPGQISPVATPNVNLAQVQPGQISPVQTPNLNLPQAQVGQLPGIGGASGLSQQLSDLLSQRLGANPADVTSDPIYRQQTDAFSRAQQRSAERQRAAMAERGAQAGTGISDAQVRGIEAGRGDAESSFEANLAGQRLQQKEQELQRAMDLARAIGDQDLQRQIAAQQAAVQQAGLGLQAQGLNQQGALAQAGLGLQAQGLNQAGQIAQGSQGLQAAGLNQQGALAQAGLGLQAAGLNQAGQIAQGSQGLQAAGLNQQGALGLGSLANQLYGTQLGALGQQQGLNLQGELGRGDLDLRRYLGQGQLGLGLLNALYGQENFGNQLGYQYTALQQQANRDALMALLGGGAI